MSVRQDLLQFDGVLRENEVHVWHADLQNIRSSKSLYELLGPEERDRARRFKITAVREQFVVSHAFLRLALAGYLEVRPCDIRFHIAANGKPYLAVEGNLRFNLSHTDGKGYTIRSSTFANSWSASETILSTGSLISCRGTLLPTEIRMPRHHL